MEKIQIFYQTGSSTPKNTVILYDSTKENPYIRDMVLKRGRGSVSSLTFVIEPTGGVQIPIPNKDRIYVRVGDPGEDIFIGYCIGIEKNFNTELTIICEHIAGRFNDIALSEIRLRKQLKVGDEVYTNTTIFHNETCYILGNTLGSQLTKLQNYINKVNGSNNYWLTGSSAITGKKPVKLDFERGTAMELINAIADKVGSIINFGFNGGPQASFAPKNYSGTATENPIEFGVNLLDLQNNYNYNPVATHLIPYGAYWKDSDYALVGTDDVDDWHRIDLKFVASEHSDIISRQMYRDIDGAYKYVYAIEGDTSTSEGFIFAEMVFDDALNAEDLYTEAKAYLQSLTAAQTVQIRAVDLSGVGDYAPGKMVNIISPEHGISGRMQIQESEMHLGEPEKDEVTIGTTASITTGSNPVSVQAMGQIINQIRTDGIGGGGSDVSLDGVVKTIMIGGVAYDVATGTHTVSLPDYPEVPTDYVPLSGGAMDTGATLSFSAQFEDGTTEVTYFGDCVNFKDSRTEADVNLYYPDDEDGNQIFATRSYIAGQLDNYLPLSGGTVTGITEFSGQFLSVSGAYGLNLQDTFLKGYSKGGHGYFVNLPQKEGTLALLSDLPDLSGFATESWVNSQGFAKGSFLPLSGGTMTAPIMNSGVVISRDTSYLVDINDYNKIGWYSIGYSYNDGSQWWTNNVLCINHFWGIDIRTGSSDWLKLNGDTIVTSANLSNYLPLSGGIVNNYLTINGHIYADLWGISGQTGESRAAFRWNKYGSYYSGIGTNSWSNFNIFDGIDVNGNWVQSTVDHWAFYGARVHAPSLAINYSRNFDVYAYFTPIYYNHIQFKTNYGNNPGAIGFYIDGYHPSIAPANSGYGYIGGPNNKWNTVYATTGSINTSDRNQKKEISYIGEDSEYSSTEMTDSQLENLIMGIKPVVYKFQQNESDRPHHGLIAQDFEKLMEEIGLTDHAGFIKSPKTEKAMETDEDGNEHEVDKIIEGEYVYGFRYTELITDLIRFCQLMKQEIQKLKGENI